MLTISLCFYSVSTADYDFNKAFGGGIDASTIESNPHPQGHLGQDPVGVNVQGVTERGGIREQVLHVLAPSGKLGVVIDTPDEGPPIVHAVKESSVLLGQVLVGDHLLAVDDEDVRTLTAIQVSKMISKRNSQPSRKLTLVRTSIVEDA